MQIPFLDLQKINADISDQLNNAAKKVIDSGYYIGGPNVQAFEEAFAKYVGASYGVGTGNGLDALVLSLKVAGIGAGDAVLVPSNTFIATWLAVSHVGATPIPVEPHPDLYTVEVEQFRAAYTDKVKAVIPVHLYGHTCHMQAIAKWAKEKDLIIIEDAAQAHGAKSGHDNVGKYAHFTCWSFYPGKNLGALGDGGMVTLHDVNLANKVRGLGNYGSAEKYSHSTIGYNSRLDPLQAAMLTEKLTVLDSWNKRRQDIAAMYSEQLADTALVLPQTATWSVPVWHLYVVRHPQRDKLKNLLAQEGVQTLIHYPIPPHKQQAYADVNFSQYNLGRTEKEAQELLSLPIGPHLSDDEVTYTIKAIKKCLQKIGS